MDVMDTLTAPQLAEALQEPNTALLSKVLRLLGQARCSAILTDALTAEASGGMLTKDGTRRRTPGGTFFQLVRDQCTKEERARLFPYVPSKKPQRPGPSAQPAQPVQSDATPLALSLDLWKRLIPMPVTATLKLVLRDLPETRESGGVVYMALQNEPRGLPKGISLDSGPLYLSAPVKQWKTACSKAEQIRTTGTPALMIGSCIRPLRIIHSTLKPTTMSPLHHHLRGHCHGTNPLFPPTRSRGAGVRLPEALLAMAQ